MRYFYLLLLLILISACKTEKLPDGSEKYKVLDSKYVTVKSIFGERAFEASTFIDPQDFNDLILEKSIPELQQAIYDGKLTYEDLTLFYLNRIYRYDRENEKSLNSVIAINKNAIEEALQHDQQLATRKKANIPFNKYSIVGMPILLKDNINTAIMPTTAGAAAMVNNITDDAPLVANLKKHGAIILGKANLSEWAYFFCSGCPSGYSAIGGQTLNPYGRYKIDTGGSSSGSGVAVAANFAVAAVGSETSGSILSPSSANSVVGLKPTVGTVSGEGVVPISSYLDTAGPIAKNVIDNAILLDAMLPLENTRFDTAFLTSIQGAGITGKRFGIFPAYKENPLYLAALTVLEKQGAILVELEEVDLKLEGFVSLLNVDMKVDLPEYFRNRANPEYANWDVARVMQFNDQFPDKAMPYGQGLLKGVIEEKITNPEDIKVLKSKLTKTAIEFFQNYMTKHNLDGFASVNNYNAGQAAVAFYPAITVPMGYNEENRPFGITFIAPTGKEESLYIWAAAFEKATKLRKLPAAYKK